MPTTPRRPARRDPRADHEPDRRRDRADRSSAPRLVGGRPASAVRLPELRGDAATPGAPSDDRPPIGSGWESVRACFDTALAIRLLGFNSPWPQVAPPRGPAGTARRPRAWTRCRRTCRRPAVSPWPDGPARTTPAWLRAPRPAGRSIPASARSWDTPAWATISSSYPTDTSPVGRVGPINRRGCSRR